jgi:hypothetical protein
MDKKTITVLASGAAVAILAAAAFYYFTKPSQEPEQTAKTEQTAELPTYGTDNPLEKKPDLNPVEKTNPFADIKINPFE